MLAAAETELPTVQELLERLRQVLQAEALSLHGPEGFALRVGRSVLDGSGGEEVRLALSLPDGAPPHTLGITGQERSRMGAIDPDRLRAELELLRNTLAQQHLREEGARQLNETRMLLELAQTTSGTVDVETILQIACDYLQRLIGVREAVIHLADEQDGLLPPVRAGDLLQDPAAPPPGPIPPITLMASRERRPVFASELPRDERLEATGHGAGGLIALPMVNREELLGVVTLFDPDPTRTLDFPQSELARATVGQLALSIANARLYESLWKSYADLAAARAEMVKRERLAALGELSAIVAHEVRNPLGVIFNAISTLRKLAPPDGDTTMLVEMVAEESDRLNRIVGDLLDFSRPRDLELEDASVGELVHAAIDVARATAMESPHPVVFRLNPPVTDVVVRVDHRLMRQALINVLLNAVQASPLGGEVEVRVTPGAPSRSEVRLEIIDSGPGIPAELRSRIFEPFFTTKARGTGLGLAVLKRIVEDHGGTVSVTSRLGAGTTFCIRLPMNGASGAEGSSLSPASRGSRYA